MLLAIIVGCHYFWGMGVRMLKLTAIFVGLMFTAVRYADLPIGRVLYSALVIAPASWLTRTSSQRIAIILFLVLGASIAWVELGPLLMAADYSPVLWVADMSVYLEALLTVTVVATALRVQSVGQPASALLRRALGMVFARRRARARSSKSRRLRLPPPVDEDAPVFAVWMAA